jgi:hypothetical protein
VKLSQKKLSTYPTEFHRIRARGITTKPSKFAISKEKNLRFQQSQSFSSLSLSSSLSTSLVVKGSVEKCDERGPGFMKGIACQKQVYASDEVADRTVRSFRSMGIKAEKNRCSQCRLLHVEERN